MKHRKILGEAGDDTIEGGLFDKVLLTEEISA